MSLKTFIKRIIEKLKELWQHIAPEVKNIVHVAVTVTDAIKNFDDKLPFAADILTALIPGTIDDKMKDKLREELPKILIGLKLVEASDDASETVLNTIKALQQLEGIQRNIAFDTIAKLTTHVLADGKIDWQDMVYIIKWYYDQRKAA